MTLKEREIGDVTVLDLAGRLVLDEGDTMVRMRVNELIVANRVKIIANLHDVTYIDSCGLGVLVAKLVSVRNKGGDLRLLHLSPRTARVFAISKLENVFETFDSEDQAVASFAESPGRSMTIDSPETERLAALRRYRILDTEPERSFDDLALLASHICGTPMALITLVDERRQWFKSRVGVSIAETSRAISFCTHAIRQRDLFIVRDAKNDARFQDNPFVTGDPEIRFYAGAPLVTPDGHALGTLCVLDRTPRTLVPEQLEALDALRRQVESQLELRLNLVELERALEERDRAEEQQTKLIAELRAAHDNVRRLSGMMPLLLDVSVHDDHPRRSGERYRP